MSLSLAPGEGAFQLFVGAGVGDDVDGVGVFASDGGFAIGAVRAVGVHRAFVVVGAGERRELVWDFDARGAEFEVLGGGDFGGG